MKKKKEKKQKKVKHRIKELTGKVQKLKKPTGTILPKSVEKKIEKKETEEKLKGEKKPVEEVHRAVKQAVEDGTVKIQTSLKDVMNKHVKTVKPDDNLKKVLELSSDYGIAGFPVLEKGKLVGVISQTDIMRIMKTKGTVDPKKDTVRVSDIKKLTVRNVMKKPITIDQNEKTTDASDLMAKHDINRLPVVDKKGSLVGIVTREDIMKSMTSEFFVKSVQMTGEASVKTGIDNLLDIIAQKKSVTIKDLSKQLNVPENQIEEWGRILEENGLIEIEYPVFFGSPKYRLKGSITPP